MIKENVCHYLSGDIGGGGGGGTKTWHLRGEVIFE